MFLFLSQEQKEEKGRESIQLDREDGFSFTLEREGENEEEFLFLSAYAVEAK